jgi:hypothetical protein
VYALVTGVLKVILNSIQGFVSSVSCQARLGSTPGRFVLYHVRVMLFLSNSRTSAALLL